MLRKLYTVQWKWLKNNVLKIYRRPRGILESREQLALSSKTKQCYIQAALILQEPIDISLCVLLLTIPSVEKAKSHSEEVGFHSPFVFS